MGSLVVAPTRFEAVVDVSGGGVLWAVPGLVANGLLHRTEEFFSLKKGFYGLIHIFLLLAIMALERIKSIERLRYSPPAEYGRLLGLDRIPEARTMREKVKVLARAESVWEWSRSLSRDWMESDVEAAGILYVDGHVRVYYGEQTKLPRRYVSRDRLCLRGTTDYWVNDMVGRPFFVVSSPLTEGLVQMLEKEIAPRLVEDVPGQPDEEEMGRDALLSRFTMVFDREGYSPSLFRRMWTERISCLTYHKFPKEEWDVSEFEESRVRMPQGNEVKMKLAERGTLLSNGFWVREIRKLTDSGHQTSVLSTDYKSSASQIGAYMFSRWCQENFFKYMMQHYDIDGLVDYQTESLPETAKVVNPAYRKLEGEIKKKAGKLSRKLAELGEMSLESDMSEKEIAEYEGEKGATKEVIDFLKMDLAALKEKRKETPKHLTLAELPQSERFVQLAPTRKRLVDTIRMIAYRAETAIAITLRDLLARPDDARSLAREIFAADADLLPDTQQGTLTVRLHHLANRLSDAAARALAEQLNQSETIYPGTDLRLVYKLVSDPNPRDQEV